MDAGSRTPKARSGRAQQGRTVVGMVTDQIQLRSPEDRSDFHRKSGHQRRIGRVALGPNIDRVGRVLLKSVNSDRTGFLIDDPEFLYPEPCIDSLLVDQIELPGVRRKDFDHEIRRSFRAGFGQDESIRVKYNYQVGLKNIYFGQVDIEWRIVKNPDRICFQIAVKRPQEIA